MTIYEGGVLVPAMVMWKDKIMGGCILDGIQSYMDIFTTLAAAAGQLEIADNQLNEKNQYIDGINNLHFWLGKERNSRR